jgi:hypothetical protein
MNFFQDSIAHSSKRGSFSLICTAKAVPLAHLVSCFAKIGPSAHLISCFAKIRPLAHLVSCFAALCSFATFIPCIAAEGSSAAPLLHSTALSSPTVAPKSIVNSCKSMSLFDLKATKSTDESLNGFYTKFESAFKDHDGKLFRSLIHPSMTREVKNADIFNSTVDDFGLEKVNLTRSSAFLLSFLEPKSQFAECESGIVRGVVGPKEQVALIHTYLGGNEQIRIFTLATKVPASVRKLPEQEWGIVMMHAQTWSHGKQTPSSLRAEAKKWNLLGEPITAWALSRAAQKILEGNPYFEPNDIQETNRLENALRQLKPNTTDLNDLAKIAGIDWVFEDITVVFQAKGLEIGLKVRMPKTEIPVNAQIDTCKKMGRIFIQKYPGTAQRFTGFECLTFLPKEDINSPSDSGSQFHRWEKG